MLDQFRFIFRSKQNLKILDEQGSQDPPTFHDDGTNASLGSQQFRLPPEILILVFECFLTNRYSSGFSFVYYSPAFNYNLNVVTTVDAQQLDLLHVTKVCRDWYIIGVTMLYSRVFLISQDRVQSFARTVTSSAHLANCVREVFVLNQELIQPIRGTWFTELRQRKSRDRATLSRESLMASLRCCSSLRSFVITNRDRIEPIILPIDTAFVQNSSIGMNLRKLMFYGSGATFLAPPVPPFLPSDILLPMLEILIFREVYVYDGYQLPYLPRLHTLKIAQSYQAEFGSSLYLDHERLPSLTRAEFYENSFGIYPDAAIYEQLIQLHVSPTRYNTRLDLPHPAPNLRHFMIHISTSRPPNLDEREIHQLADLESLVVTVKSIADEREVECLRLLMEQLNQNQCRIQRIIILTLYFAASPFLTSTEVIVSELTNVVGWMGTTVSADTDIHEWIGQSLNCPFGLI